MLIFYWDSTAQTVRPYKVYFDTAPSDVRIFNPECPKTS